MVKKKTWGEFRKTGMLWFVNTILHAFGWAIVVVYDGKKIVDVFPARVKFRGFDKDSNEQGYINISEYMKENADELLKEARGDE